MGSDCPCPKHPLGCYGHPHKCGCADEAKSTAARIAELEAALSAEKAKVAEAKRMIERRTQERDAAGDCWRIDATRFKSRAEAAEAEAARLREALEPFVAVAENDIGESEDDADLFRPMRAPRLTVGHFRKARAALGGEHG